MSKPFKSDANRQTLPLNTNFEEIFFQSPIGIFFYDKTGRLTNANDSALKIARIPKLDDVLGTNLFDNPKINSKKEDLHEKGLIKFQDILDLIQINEQNIYNPIESEIIDIDWTVSNTDSGYMVQIQDITDIKKAEKKNKMVLDSIVERYAEFDNEWRYVDVNSKIEEIYNMNRNEIIGKVLWDIFPQLLGSKQCKMFCKAKKENIPLRFESKSIVSGEWFEVNVYPHHEGISIYSHNINERKKAEEEIISERNIFDVIIESAGGPIFSIDRNYRYTSFNSQHAEVMKTLFDVNIEIGDNLLDHHTNPEDRKNAKLNADKAFKGETVIIESFAEDSPQNRQYFSIFHTPIKNSNGKITGVAVYAQDLTGRKKAEEKLKKSEKRFRAVQENSITRFTILKPFCDAQGTIIDFTIDYQNAQAAETTGHKPEELIGRRMTEIWPTFTKTRFFEMYKLATETSNGMEFEQRYNDDGLDEWFYVKITPIPEGIAIATEIITERKKAEEVLQETKKKYLGLFNNKIFGLAYCKTIMDENNKPIDYSFLEVNDTYEQLTGLKREDVVNKRITEILPGFEQSLIDKHNKVALTGNDINFETYEPNLKSWYDVTVYSPQKGYFISIFTNITYQKNLFEDNLNHQKVLGAINRVFHEYLKTDTVNEVVQKCLELAENLTESEFGFFGEINENERLDDRALSPPVWDVCETQNAQERLRNMKIVSYWGRTIKEEKSQIVNDPNSDPDSRGLPDGHPPITSFLGVPLKDGEKTIGMIALANKKSGYNQTDKKNVETLGVAFVEVFLRKKAEIDKENYLENLVQSNKELEQFAYITSHDLREPLRMITSFLQLLERRYKDQLDKDANEFIDFAVNGAKRLDAMTNDLLKYSQITNKKREFEPVNFEHVLEHALTNLKVQIKENNTIITHDPLPIIKADEPLKIQLFQNIIANAIKYRSQETPKIHISAIKENNQYLFSIKDNGIGMSNKHLKKIFTIFNRLHTHEEYEGTGIGLAIVQKIVHQQGGQIWVESELGKGSTFYFTIPIKN